MSILFFYHQKLKKDEQNKKQNQTDVQSKRKKQKDRQTERLKSREGQVKERIAFNIGRQHITRTIID